MNLTPEITPPTPQNFRNFEDFWPTFVRRHADAKTQWLHLGGTVLSFAVLAAAAFVGQPVLLAGAVLVAYGVPWLGHLVLGTARPLNFEYPRYGLLGDWRMFGLTMNGRMKNEVERVLSQKGRA